MLVAAETAERSDRAEITIVIADGHALVREGLRLLLDNEEDLQVVAEARTVPDAERLTRAYRPGVLVLDLDLRGDSSLEAISRLRETAPETAIIVLTLQADPAFARRALRAGAMGYVLKDAAAEELLRTIRRAHREPAAKSQTSRSRG
jgi:two-component system response regulator NreC